MNPRQRQAIGQIDAQGDSLRQSLCRRLADWCQISSGTDNLAGMARMAGVLVEAFAAIADESESIDVRPGEILDARGRVQPRPLGKLLRFTKRAGAARRVLLVIHYDTVYGVDHPFQHGRLLEGGMLNAPGAADAKGGILIMLEALRALEASESPADFGWDVILNPDEEIGSPGSAPVLAEAAKRAGLALLFEPSYPDGTLISSRKGSGNFSVVVHGRSAHAGRDFAQGRNAILALARLIDAIDVGARELGGGVTINCGRVEGGGAVNVVPDLAIGHFNARAEVAGEDRRVTDLFTRVVEAAGRQDGIRATLHGGFTSPPKPLDRRSLRLFEAVRDCGTELGLPIQWKPSGGASDGNRLAAAGLPVVDSLGAVGGKIHSDEEYADTAALVQRVKLVALLLMRLAEPAEGGGGRSLYEAIASRE